MVYMHELHATKTDRLSSFSKQNTIGVTSPRYEALYETIVYIFIQSTPLNL